MLSIYGYVAVGIVLLLFALFVFAALVVSGREDDHAEDQRRQLWQAREKTEAEAARFRALVEIRNSVNRRVN